LLYNALRGFRITNSLEEARGISLLLERSVTFRWFRVAVLLDFWVFYHKFLIAVSREWKQASIADDAIRVITDLLEDQDPGAVIEYISKEIRWIAGSGNWPFFSDRLDRALTSPGIARWFRTEYACHALARARDNAEKLSEPRFLKIVARAMKLYCPALQREDIMKSPSAHVSDKNSAFFSHLEPSHSRFRKVKQWWTAVIRKGK